MTGGKRIVEPAVQTAYDFVVYNTGGQAVLDRAELMCTILVVDRHPAEGIREMCVPIAKRQVEFCPHGYTNLVQIALGEPRAITGQYVWQAQGPFANGPKSLNGNVLIEGYTGRVVERAGRQQYLCVRIGFTFRIGDAVAS